MNHIVRDELNIGDILNTWWGINFYNPVFTVGIIATKLAFKSGDYYCNFNMDISKNVDLIIRPTITLINFYKHLNL
jgi:hypothetical protein